MKTLHFVLVYDTYDTVRVTFLSHYRNCVNKHSEIPDIIDNLNINNKQNAEHSNISKFGTMIHNV